MAKWEGTNKPNSSRLVLCLSGVSDRIIQCFTYAQISPPEAATSVLPHGPRRVSASASALERKIKKICSSYVCGRVEASASLPRCVSCVILRMYVCMYALLCGPNRACLFCPNHASCVTLQPSDPDVTEQTEGSAREGERRRCFLCRVPLQLIQQG